jgi:hypothetical protein
MDGVFGTDVHHGVVHIGSVELISLLTTDAACTA